MWMLAGWGQIWWQDSGRDLNCFHFLFEAKSKVMTCLEGEDQGLPCHWSTVEEDMGRSPLSRSTRRPRGHSMI